MSLSEYLDTVFIKINKDGQGNPIIKEILGETHVVFGNVIVLNQIPDFQSKVQIDGMFELRQHQTIDNENEYKVDYKHGFVYFHPDKSGQGVTVTRYFGRGIVYYSSARIYNKLSEDGKDVEETLEDFIESISAYVFKGNYDNNIAYKANEQVYYNGQTYIAKTDTQGNLPTSTLHWRVLAAGFNDKQDFNIETQYYFRDVVWYDEEKALYVASDNPPVGTLPTDENYWEVFVSVKDIYEAETLRVQAENERQVAINRLTHVGEYDSETTYYPRNIVYYNGSGYMCTAESTGNTPTETGFWQMVSGGLMYKQNFEIDVQYNYRDVVWYDEEKALYVAKTTPPMGTVPTDDSYWEVLISVKDVYEAEALRVLAENTRVSSENIRISQENTRQTAINRLQHQGEYDASTQYQVRNIVSYLGSSYMCIQTSQGNLPTNESFWKVVSFKGDKGAELSPKGAYNELVVYEVGDLVTYDGSVYNCIQTSQGNLPTNENYWEVFILAGGDMQRAVYDTNESGVVDDSERLGGELPEYYAQTANLDNHINDNTNPHGVTKEQVGLGNVINKLQVTHPELVSGVTEAKQYTDQQIDAVESIISHPAFYQYKLVATEENQTKFKINISNYDASSDSVVVFKNTTLYPYSFNMSKIEDKHYLILDKGIALNHTLVVWVFKDIEQQYSENDIYGVEVDFEENTFERIAGSVGKEAGEDFNNTTAFGGRKRCNLTDDGVVVAYYGETGYSETGALTQSITLGEGENEVTYAVGTHVQTMVEQPKFYYKVVPLKFDKITDGIGYHLRKARYYVSDKPKVGFKVHPAFVRNGVEKDKIYLPAYEGCVQKADGTYILNDDQGTVFTAGSGDKLASIAFAKPVSGLTQQLTRPNTRNIAANRGEGWQQKDALCASASQILLMIEYNFMNSQTVIGLGVVNKASGEGNESELTGATSNLGNASGMAAGTNGLVSISYRGEENFWGNTWSWVDGLNIEAFGIHEAWWADHDFTDNTKAEPYKNAGFTLAKANGYISAIGWSEACDFLFLPSEVTGNSSLPVGDNFWQNHASNSWFVARLGGSWANGVNAGAFCWAVHHSSATLSRVIGGGVVYVPQN